MDLGLRGKAALVTGASEGIGEGVARGLAEEGVEVAICARRADKLKAVAEQISRDTGVRVIPIPADLSSLEGCRSFVQAAAAALGRIDILVNNAGASAFGPFIELPDEAFVEAINLKLLGYIRCTREVIPHLLQQGGGTIIHITGTTQEAIPLHTPGSACNAAIRMFAKETANELGALGIRVNSLAPGRIESRRANQLLEATAAERRVDPSVILADLVKQIPAGRIGTPKEIADVVCFLVSDRASYIYGASILVDGGKARVI